MAWDTDPGRPIASAICPSLHLSWYSAYHICPFTKESIPYLVLFVKWGYLSSLLRNIM